MRRGPTGVIIDVLGAPASLLQLEESQERGELSEVCRLPVDAVEYLPPDPVRLPVSPRPEASRPVRATSVAGARVRVPALMDPLPAALPPPVAASVQPAGVPAAGPRASVQQPSFGFQPSSPGVAIGRLGGSTAEDLAVVSQPIPELEPPEIVQTGVNPTHSRARPLTWVAAASLVGIVVMASLLWWGRSEEPFADRVAAEPVPAEPASVVEPAAAAEAAPVVEVAAPAAEAPAPAVEAPAPAEPVALSTQQFESLALEDALSRRDPLIYRAAFVGHVQRIGDSPGGRRSLHTEALLSLSQAERLFAGEFERLVVPAPARLEISGDPARTQSFTLGRGVVYGDTQLRVLVLRREAPAALVRLHALSGESRPATGWVLAAELGI